MVDAAIQGELWSSDPVGWAEAAESRNQPLYERILQRLDLRPRTRVLDVGCGAGRFAELAAAAGADVVGLDAAPGLLEYARRWRPMADYLVGDLEHLPFDSGAFDVVTAFNSVLYAADPRAALRELARVATPAGRTVVTVGAGPEQAESARLIGALMPRERLVSRTLDLTDEDSARRALTDAGFASVTCTDIGFGVRFDSVDAAVAAQLPAGPVAAAIRHSGRPAVEAALRSFFAPRVQRNTTVRMDVVFRCYLVDRAPSDQERQAR